MPVSYIHIFKLLLIESLDKNPERNLKIVLIRREMLFRTDDYLKERKMKGRSKLSVFKMEGIRHWRLDAAECGMKSEVTACAGIIEGLLVNKARVSSLAAMQNYVLVHSIIPTSDCLFELLCYIRKPIKPKISLMKLVRMGQCTTGRISWEQAPRTSPMAAERWKE